MSSFTMSPGIVLEDGTVLGRMSDVELFGSWAIQTDKTILNPEIDGVSDKVSLFSEADQQRIRKNNTGGRLWKISRKGQAQIDRELQADKRRNMKHRLEVLAQAHEWGLLIPQEDDSED